LVPHKLTPEDAWRPTPTERDECRERLKALHVFDIETGQELWKELLLASAQATPMTYRLGDNGKQCMVIAAVGHGRLGSKKGDDVVAFTLP
jgi:glucose dehydrogenase